MNTDMIWQTTSTGSGDTERLGKLLGKQLGGGEVIELLSDLGGGKTTFVRGLVEGAGSRDIVASPTFTLYKIYKAGDGKEIHHFDFYRLGEPGVVAPQLAESLENPSVITVVEWSDIVRDALPNDRISVQLEPVNHSSNERKLTISYTQPLVGIIRKWETLWQENRP